MWAARKSILHIVPSCECQFALRVIYSTTYGDLPRKTAIILEQEQRDPLSDLPLSPRSPCLLSFPGNGPSAYGRSARREAMVLWRHECSRYASSSRIGYHPNHPSASRPSSRPSSAATILRPFSAGRVPQHSQQRASSARPARLRPQEVHTGVHEAGPARATDEVGRGGPTTHARPRSAIPRLGLDLEGEPENAEEEKENDSRPRRGVSASAAMDGGNGTSRENDSSFAGRRRGGSRDKRGGGSNATGVTRSTSARSQSLASSNPDGLSYEGVEGEEIFDDIYEDLDEDDDELDNRISIMESRFSTVGRERPDSAVEDGLVGSQHRRRSGPRRAATNAAPRSAMTQRPPRAPPQEHRQLTAGPQPPPQQRFISSAEAERSSRRESRGDATDDVGQRHPTLSSTGVNGVQAPRIIRSRPTSAPVDGGSSIYQYQQDGGGSAVRDPMAPLHARRLRLQMSSAGAEESRSQVGRDRAWSTRDEYQHQHQQRIHLVRDVRRKQPFFAGFIPRIE